MSWRAMFHRYLCSFNNVAKLANPQPDAVRCHKDETISTVDWFWPRLNKPRLTVTPTCMRQHSLKVTWLAITEVWSASTCLFAGAWRPTVSVITTLYYVAIIFHRQVWYHALSLSYACIRRSSIILIPAATFVPNFVSFTTSTAELARGEKSCTQSPSLLDVPGTERGTQR